MLILVGVTINFALNGGIITKAKEATIQTEIAMIQEQLMLKKAEILADNMGSVPNAGYGLSSISDLDGLSESIISKYNSKLTISPDGTLYYLEDKVTGEEKVYFENAGITSAQKSEKKLVEYYVASNENDSEIIEGVYVVDYENSNIQYYMSQEGETFTLVGGAKVSLVEAPFTIELSDNSQATITSGVAMTAEISENVMYVAYINNQRLYLSEEGIFSEHYATLDPNFDTSRLVEVQAKTIEYYVGTTNNVSCVSVINYTNNTISYYQSSDNITYTLMPNSSGSITFGHETGTVTIDGETVTLSENDTIIYDENNEEHLALIRNNNIYFADNPTRYLSLGGGTLDPDFDASVLPE